MNTERYSLSLEQHDVNLATGPDIKVVRNNWAAAQKAAESTETPAVA
jgi:hypothetical protein